MQKLPISLPLAIIKAITVKGPRRRRPDFWIPPSSLFTKPYYCLSSYSQYSTISSRTHLDFSALVGYYPWTRTHRSPVRDQATSPTSQYLSSYCGSPAHGIWQAWSEHFAATLSSSIAAATMLQQFIASWVARVPSSYRARSGLCCVWRKVVK